MLSLSVCLSMHLSFRLSVCLSVSLCVCLSVCLSDFLCVCLSISQSVCLSVCLSISLLNYITATPFLSLCHASYRSIWFNYLSFFLTFLSLFRLPSFNHHISLLPPVPIYVPQQKQREHSRWPDGIIPQVEMTLKSLMPSSVKILTIKSNPLEGCREYNWLFQRRSLGSL